MTKRCKNKYRFKIWNEAQRFAESYQKEVTLVFNPMRPYWCDRHEVWHIGHDMTERIDYANGARILPNYDRIEILSENDA